MLHDDATSEWVGMCGILRTCFVSEDAFAARMCFVGEEPVEVSRLTLLRWSFAEARLDTYRVESVGDQFHVRAERETQVRVDSVPARCRGLDAGDDDEVDLLASLESRGAAQRRRVQQPRPKPTPAVRMVQDAVDADPLQELMQELMQEVTEPGDAVSQPLPTELEDDEAAAAAAADGVEDGVPDDGLGVPAGAGVGSAQDQPDGVLAEQQAPSPGFDIERSPIYDSGSWHYRTRDGNQSVGRVHHMNPSTLKATCRVHKSCACTISLPPAPSARLTGVQARLGRDPVVNDVQNDLMEWLSKGSAVTGAEHDRIGRCLRSERWFVKVRPARG